MSQEAEIQAKMVKVGIPDIRRHIFLCTDIEAARRRS